MMLVFVPVGGGGILAGVSSWIAQHDKKVKVIGVEVEDSACFAEAIKANKRSDTQRSWTCLLMEWQLLRVGKYNFDVFKRVC